VNCRIATLKDSNQIAELHARSWRESYRGIFSDTYLDSAVWEDRKKCWFDRLSDPKPNQYVLVLTDSDSIEGFICAFGNYDPIWGTFIDNLHVSSSFKRKGLGKLLMQKVANWTMQNFPYDGLHLEVLEKNASAQSFYKSLGAVHQETRLWAPPFSEQKVKDLLYIWITPEQLVT